MKFDLEYKVLSEDSARKILFDLGIDKNKSFDEIKLQDEQACEKGFQMLNFGVEFNDEFVYERYYYAYPRIQESAKLRIGSITNVTNWIEKYQRNRNSIWYTASDIYLRAISIHLKNLDRFDFSLLGEISKHAFEFFFNERAISLKRLKITRYFQSCALTSDLIECLQNLNELEVGHQISRHALALSMLPNLRKLIISYVGRTFSNLFENVKFENLEWLELKDDLWNNALNGHVLMTITKNCPNLTKLVIAQCNVTNEDLDVIKNLSKLCCFRVRNCRYITKEYFEEMFGEIGFFE